MQLKLGVSGFQSITKAVLDVPESSIVGIVGDNNLGKSALIRALKSFIQNSADKESINSRMREAKVIFKSDRGLYSWTRLPATTKYTINKVEKVKLNRAPLFEMDPNCPRIVTARIGESVVVHGTRLTPLAVLEDIR